MKSNLENTLIELFVFLVRLNQNWIRKISIYSESVDEFWIIKGGWKKKKGNGKWSVKFHSGGEKISGIEVESVFFSHPLVLEAAVVERSDDHWGETSCAFGKLKDDCIATWKHWENLKKKLFCLLYLECIVRCHWLCTCSFLSYAKGIMQL